MGTNLLKKAQKSFEKHIDASLMDVSTGDLFDQATESCPRQFVADPSPNASISIGDEIAIELRGEIVVGTRGVEKVFEANHPPKEIVDHIKSQSGIAGARIAKINPLSGTLEIDLC